MIDSRMHLTEAELHLKQISPRDLNDLGKAALTAAFTGFFDANQPTPDAVERHAQDGTDDPVAGDPSNEEGNAYEKAVYGKVL